MAVSEAELVDAIVADPDDVGRRLVYADWLEARGDPRGELVRLDVRLASDDLSEHMRNALSRRHITVREAVRQRMPGVDSFASRLGLIEMVTMKVPAFVAHGAPLLAAGVTRVQLDGIGVADLGELAAAPHLAAARDLCLVGDMGAAGLEALARSPHFRPHRLRISRSYRSDPEDAIDAALAAIVRSEGTAALRACDFHLEWVHERAVQALAEARHWNHLVELGLAWCHLRPGSVARILAAPFVPRLGRLDVSHNVLGEDDARALAEAPCDALEELHLGYGACPDAVADALARAPGLGALRTLAVGGNDGLGPASLARLEARFGAALRM